MDADLIHRLNSQLNDMEAINADLGIGKKFVNDGLVSGIHIHCDRFHLSPLGNRIVSQKEVFNCAGQSDHRVMEPTGERRHQYR